MGVNGREKLSDFVARIATDNKNEVTIGDLMMRLHERGHWLTCLFFATPFLLPIPLPGVSTPFGVVIFFAAAQIIFGKDPWTPRRWRSIAIPAKFLHGTFSKLGTGLRKIEKLTRPRLLGVVNSSHRFHISALSLAVLAILLSLPMVPGFNAPPAAGVVALSIGNLEDDGLMILGGLILTILNIILFGGIFILGFETIKNVLV